MQEIGVAAVEMLMQQIEAAVAAPETGVPETRVLPVRVLVRESTAPAPQEPVVR